MMFDHSKLRGLIIEKFETRAAFAKAMGLLPSTLSGRLKGQTKFTTEEVAKAVELLEIPAEEISTYFLVQKVQ